MTDRAAQSLPRPRQTEGGPSFAVLERKLGGVRHELHNI
jgi:hypothetical protein